MSKILLLKTATNGSLSTLTRIRNLSTHLFKKPGPRLSPLQHFPIFSPGPLAHLTHKPTNTHTIHFPIRALTCPPTKEKEGGERNEERGKDGDDKLASGSRKVGDEEYPSGEFQMVEFGWWMGFIVKLRMLFAFPWERVKKGSVLSIKLKGEISDQLATRFSSMLSLAQICENLTKAAHDPRISGVYLQIEPLRCGWGKVDEIRRHILDFKKSGKFIVSYVPICREKEYYLACACGEVYMPPSAYVGLYGLTVQSSFLGDPDTGLPLDDQEYYQEAEAEQDLDLFVEQ